MLRSACVLCERVYAQTEGRLDVPVQAQNFAEDEDEDHGHEHLRLEYVCAYTLNMTMHIPLETDVPEVARI